RLLQVRKAETLKRGWRDIPPWVFCSGEGTPLDRNNAAKAFRRCLQKAGLPLRHSLYDLRHTFATILVAQGKPITYVAKQLGHENPSTTLRWYTHWLPSVEDKSYVDDLDTIASGALSSVVDGSEPDSFGTNLAPICGNDVLLDSQVVDLKSGA